MKKKLLFLINPISGGKSKGRLPEYIHRELDASRFDYRYRFTEYVGHARELAKEAIEQQVDMVVAVGGDGTINEVASALVGSPVHMGIVPMGSGNGLATALGISRNPAKAIRQLSTASVHLVDSASINGHPIFNVSGMGFDAEISALFAKETGRGLWGYVKNTLSAILHYQPQNYTLELNGEKFSRTAFMISLANSTQFGNNAHISPEASITDGLLDICVVKPFPLYKFPLLAYRLFSRTAHKSSFIEIYKTKETTITRSQEGPVHLDGEPIVLGTTLHIVLHPASLYLLY
ncbi:MAG: diacylglycerol/lipid kinase family protein [Sphingobacteriaceae bacterium]